VRRSLIVVLAVLATAAVCAQTASARFSLFVTVPAVRPVVAPPHVIATVRSGLSVAVYDRPFGQVITRVDAQTEFGSPRALAVAGTRRGRWLAVKLTTLGNDRVGWIDARGGGLRYRRTGLDVDIDLSLHRLTLRNATKVLRTVSVGVGRPGSPTPTGRFAVTDKLSGPAYSAYYGCCILALSATQPNLPAGWSGGNRIAIHGTPNAGDFGRDVSAGCVHAPDDTLRYLMRTLPLGTPVVIRP
jgi:lipoprotein-anchoring transpeptidase ErfK/SrfK